LLVTTNIPSYFDSAPAIDKADNAPDNVKLVDGKGQRHLAGEGFFERRPRPPEVLTGLTPTHCQLL
jgi:hypothetical protein